MRPQKQGLNYAWCHSLRKANCFVHSHCKLWFFLPNDKANPHLDQRAYLVVSVWVPGEQTLS